MISMYDNNIIETTSINVSNDTNNKNDDQIEIQHELSVNIPKLSDILDNKIPIGSVYSNYNFTQYLIKKHCVENLYFYNEIIILLEDYDNFKIYNWLTIYTKFIECDDINLPGDLLIKLNKNKDKLPCINLLIKIKKIIIGYLHNSFHEFLNELKIEMKIEKFSCISSLNSASLCSSPCSTSLTSNEIEVNDAKTEVSVNTSSSLSTKNNLVQNSNNRHNNDVNNKKGNKNDSDNNNDNDNTNRKKEKDDIYGADITNNTNNTKSWNKLTNKFKWKRRTSSSSSC